MWPWLAVHGFQLRPTARHIQELSILCVQRLYDRAPDPLLAPEQGVDGTVGCVFIVSAGARHCHARIQCQLWECTYIHPRSRTLAHPLISFQSHLFLSISSSKWHRALNDRRQRDRAGLICGENVLTQLFCLPYLNPTDLPKSPSAEHRVVRSCTTSNITLLR
jgi:hypothetical protein